MMVKSEKFNCAESFDKIPLFNDFVVSDNMVQLLAFAKLVITKPQITCLCPHINSGK